MPDIDGMPDAPGYREALDLAAETFQLIREYKAPPIPKAYEVLYSYVSRDRDAVKIRVDEAVERHGVLNLYDIDQIHSDYFSYTEAMQSRQHETVGSMDAELDNLMSIITEQSESTSVYSRSLDVARGSLAQGRSPEQLRAAIQLLLSETQRINEHSREMVEQLQASQEAIQNLKSSLANAAEEGLRDGLTGLKNRRHFDRILPEEIAEAEMNGSPLVLCILDVDNFSDVNDRFG
ncbi:MAG: diguanylate cyclase, partial [Pseudomonadota bacterium]